MRTLEDAKQNVLDKCNKEHDSTVDKVWAFLFEWCKVIVHRDSVPTIKITKDDLEYALKKIVVFPEITFEMVKNFDNSSLGTISRLVEMRQNCAEGKYSKG